MPKHPIYTHFLTPEAQAVIGEVHPQTAPARAVLEKEGFRYRNYVDIFDGGPTLECDIDRVRAIRKSRLVDVSEGQPAPGDWRRAVANENYTNFRAMLVRTNPKCERLVLTAAELDALKCNAGDTVRRCDSALRRKQHDFMDQRRLGNGRRRTASEDQSGRQRGALER